MASSYNGWSVIFDRDSSLLNATWEPIPGHDFPGGIRRGDVEVVFTYLVRNLHTRVEPIVIYPPGDEWGWAPRANVNNPNLWSCHASATAIDYNATEHPNKVDFTWTRAQSLEIHKIIDDELDGVIKWLEGYDEMHFEIRGTAAQVKAVADKIRNGTIAGPKPQPQPITTQEDDMFYYDRSGDSGKPDILVHVVSGKQIRITNETYKSTMRKTPEYRGKPDANTVARYDKAFGPLISNV